MTLKKSKGHKLGGSIVYGYDVQEEGKTKVLIKNEEEQKVIQSIKRYKSKGLSLGAIAKKLNERGITTKNGKEFQSMQVKRILDYKHS
jgi:DNA invertase Pin-like site-specific DNA recombinase